MSLLDARHAAQETIRQSSADLIELSHRIHDDPELGFAEYHAVDRLAEALVSGGYSVTKGICDLPTAFVARKGEGELHIGICAEYDALPDIGHACGHNVIAAAAVAAALALAPLAEELGVIIEVFGTPAEEGGGGKILMLERGAFNGVHAAMMVHPSPKEEAAPATLAVSHLEVEYTGRTAHASAYPERGINAADALTVAQVAVGLLRQHTLSGQRIHDIVTKGGAAPNIVPARTTASYYVRAASLNDLGVLEPRVRSCFDAGAIATGCSVEVRPLSPPYSEFEPDADLVCAYTRNAEALGRHPHPTGGGTNGSTDMANVSLAIPAMHPRIRIDCDSAVNHQPEFAEYCATPSADKAILDGGLAMAWTTIDLAADATIRQRLLSGKRNVMSS